MADISITAANFVPSANATIIQGVAGEAMTRGQTLYYDSTNALYKLFSATNTSKDVLAGLACEDAATNQPMLVVTKDPALVIGGAAASGDTVWGSNVAGGMTKTFADVVSTWRVWVLGVANATNTINFVPCKGGVK